MSARSLRRNCVELREASNIPQSLVCTRYILARARSRTLTATRCNSDANPLHRANDLRNALDTLNSGVRAGSWFAEYPRISLHLEIGWLRFTSLKSRRGDYQGIGIGESEISELRRDRREEKYLSFYFFISEVTQIVLIVSRNQNNVQSRGNWCPFGV